MISVCIPVYNFDVNALVKSLNDEIEMHQLGCEIILIDDCSEQKFQTINQPAFARAKHVQLTENIGRSKIRNLFLNYVSKEYLLFLDCDCLIISNDFLRRYISEIRKDRLVVCGGRVYPSKRPERARLLRWKYGIKKESKPASERKANPNKSFMTNNFLIHKTVLEKIKFDERLTEYGHEDTLFGIELKQAKITIEHIENPILNGDIETNTVFLEKTEKALENLVLLVESSANPEEVIDEIHLLQTAKKLKSMEGLVRFYHTLFGKITKLMLTRGMVSMFCFDLYKLGYFLSKKNK